MFFERPAELVESTRMAFQMAWPTCADGNRLLVQAHGCRAWEALGAARLCRLHAPCEETESPPHGGPFRASPYLMEGRSRPSLIPTTLSGAAAGTGGSAIANLVSGLVHALADEQRRSATSFSAGTLLTAARPSFPGWKSVS